MLKRYISLYRTSKFCVKNVETTNVIRKCRKVSNFFFPASPICFESSKSQKKNIYIHFCSRHNLQKKYQFVSGKPSPNFDRWILIVEFWSPNSFYFILMMCMIGKMAKFIFIFLRSLIFTFYKKNVHEKKEK